DLAVRVLPGATADAVACVLGFCAGGAEIRTPSLGGGTGRLRQPLAKRVGAFEAAKISTIAGAGAGDEEGHHASLRLQSGRGGQRGEYDRRGNGDFHRSSHRIPLHHGLRYIVQAEPAFPASMANKPIAVFFRVTEWKSDAKGPQRKRPMRNRVMSCLGG